MFKKVFILIILILTNIYGQNKLKAINGETFHFGTITKGEKVSHIFEIKNISKSNISIEKVQSSCGCTAVLLSKKLLKPNETTQIKAEFNSEGFKGYQEKHIYVYEAKNPNPILTLTLQANVFVAIDVVPMYMVFDNVVVGEEKQSIVQLINRTNKKIKILEIENNNQNLKINIDKKELNPNESCYVTGIFRPDVSGLIRGSFFILTDSKQKRIEVKFYCNAKDKL